MRRVLLVLLALPVLSSCAMFEKPKTMEQVRAKLICVEYKEGMNWSEIRDQFGDADVAPLPEPGTNLQQNARAYRIKWIIFNVENREFKENGKTRFHEVATKIEVCKEK